MTLFVKSQQFKIAGLPVGGILGFANYFFHGHDAEIRAIASKPINSLVYVAVLGCLIFSVFENYKSKNISEALELIDHHKISPNETDFGQGNSAQLFLESIENEAIWEINHQKQFKDIG